MRKFLFLIYGLIALLVFSCKKDDKAPEPLPAASVDFLLSDMGKDTLQMPVSILRDSTIVIGLKAAFSGQSSSDIWVNFAVDTTKIREYRDQYGDALLLPVTSYFFYKSMTKIPAGSGVSDSAQINIAQQTKLREYSTYVLPLVIGSVNGEVEGPASERVVYLVFKTGKPLFVNKEGWTIQDFSSKNGTSNPQNVLDANNTTTFWASSITQQMPQWVTINFNKSVDFEAVNYYLPTALRYPTLGGYPTSIRIETSVDGTTWVSKGEFEGAVENNTQSIFIGATTARFLRFTSLACVKYSNAYEAVFISGISLVP